MKHESIPVGAFQCNCHILADDSGEAVIIDPGDDADKIIEIAKDFKVRYLVHTHCHLDHISGTRKVADATGAKVLIHEQDRPLYENLPEQARAFGWDVGEPAPIDETFTDSDVIRFGKHELEILHTPGHTPGSCCFRVADQGLVFSGDTLFQRSIGRTDLWGGDYEQELESIRSKLFSLDPDTLVHPGHGPDTRIREEKEQNPFLQ
jgi:hydroxyacylglutathione hydrolase